MLPLLARARDDLAISLIFLTRLPIPFQGDIPRHRITEAMGAFPAVGALVGLWGGIVYASALGLFGMPFLAATLAVTGQLLLTGAFHEDGLADTADGFGGGSTRERKLEIMRDSRLGTYGAAALVLALLMRIATTMALAEPWAAAIGLICSGALSRAMIVSVIKVLPPAAADGQSAEAGQPPFRAVAIALASAGALSCLLFPIAVALAALSATLAAAVLMAALSDRHLKGQTGDVLGATQQVSEIACLLGLLACR